jgi:hypothetical protein
MFCPFFNDKEIKMYNIDARLPNYEAVTEAGNEPLLNDLDGPTRADAPTNEPPNTDEMTNILMSVYLPNLDLKSGKDSPLLKIILNIISSIGCSD